MLDLETLAARLDGTVLYATFDHPPLNVVDAAMVRDFDLLIEHVENNAGVRVVVFKSANPDFFLAHADLTGPSSAADGGTRRAAFRRLSEMKAVSIAEVRGRVRAAGSEFLLACDMSFASRERAILNQFDVGSGAIPANGGLQHLSRMVGRQRALEIILGSDDLCASIAEDYGWINRAIPDGDLESFVSALAQRIASFPPAAVIGAKQRINAATLPENDEILIDAQTSETASASTASRVRMNQLVQRGLQMAGELEREFGRILAELPEV
jgi:enoyl-CoA hydratase/carnithine racemase